MLITACTWCVCVRVGSVCGISKNCVWAKAKPQSRLDVTFCFLMCTVGGDTFRRP